AGQWAPGRRGPYLHDTPRRTDRRGSMTRAIGAVMTVPPQPYESPAPEVQGTAAPQAPAPPIPALPARPGASTGATGSAGGGVAATGDAARDQVRAEVQNALREVRDGLRDGFRQAGEGTPQAIAVQP